MPEPHDPEAIHPIPFLARWLTWPVALIGSLAATIIAPKYGLDPVAVSGAASGMLILLLVVMERTWPADPKWRMTWRSFLRDIQFFLVNGLTIGATNVLFAVIGGAAADNHSGPRHGLAALDHSATRHLRGGFHPILGAPHRP
jgi:hypothetical protein